jgi:hypothetical protein
MPEHSTEREPALLRRVARLVRRLRLERERPESSLRGEQVEE